MKLNFKNLERKRFARWQQIRITQLSYIVNLIIAISCACLGFMINFISDLNSELSFCTKILFWTGSILTITSIGLAIVLSIIRLENFRITALIALDTDRENISDSHNHRKKSKKYDKQTWCLFIWQMSTFFVGLFAFLIAVLIEFRKMIL